MGKLNHLQYRDNGATFCHVTLKLGSTNHVEVTHLAQDPLGLPSLFFLFQNIGYGVNWVFILNSNTVENLSCQEPTEEKQLGLKTPRRDRKSSQWCQEWKIHQISARQKYWQVIKKGGSERRNSMVEWNSRNTQRRYREGDWRLYQDASKPVLRTPKRKNNIEEKCLAVNYMTH